MKTLLLNNTMIRTEFLHNFAAKNEKVLRRQTLKVIKLGFKGSVRSSPQAFQQNDVEQYFLLDGGEAFAVSRDRQGEARNRIIAERGNFTRRLFVERLHP